MKKRINPSTILNPVPVIMLSCGSMDKPNIVTLAWAGTVNSEPPMLSVSIRKSRYSHQLVSESGKFVVNLVSEKLAKACDYCGVKSGRDTDKFKDTGLTPEETLSGVPAILESPINIECTVKQVLELGSHDMFIAEVTNVLVDESIIDQGGKIDFEKAHLVAYCHGGYYALGQVLGFFGYSIARPKVLKNRMNCRTNTRKCGRKSK